MTKLENLEDLLRTVGEGLLRSGTPNPEEYALAVSGPGGVHLLLPNEKKLIRIAKRAPPMHVYPIRRDTIVSYQLSLDKVCINDGILYDSVSGTAICNAVEEPGMRGGSNPLAEEIRQRKEEEARRKGRGKSSWLGRSEPKKPKPFRREGYVTGLRSINGKLFDFGAFASGTRAYAVFDTLACPTGKETPIALRDHPIISLFEHNGAVLDVSNGRLFSTYKCPFGKEGGVGKDKFAIRDAYSHEGRIYVVDGNMAHVVIYDLEQLLHEGKPVREVKPPKPQGIPLPPRQGRLNFRFFLHNDSLLLAKLIAQELPDRRINQHATIYDPFSDYAVQESANLCYGTSPLVAKSIGAVPISKDMFDSIIGDERIFNEVAKPSMLDEIQSKLELAYREAEKQVGQNLSLLQNKSEAQKLFAALRELRGKVVSEYAAFGIKENEVKAGPLESKFKHYEQMVARG
ncbi:hypothetical protein KY360_03565 [Candidatus Woesearchaeota archaeon]|nr:hypothetical protein [Candidatus Woesearchaeota archaeon]